MKAIKDTLTAFKLAQALPNNFLFSPSLIPNSSTTSQPFSVAASGFVDNPRPAVTTTLQHECPSHSLMKSTAWFSTQQETPPTTFQSLSVVGSGLVEDSTAMTTSQPSHPHSLTKNAARFSTQHGAPPAVTFQPHSLPSCSSTIHQSQFCTWQ